MYFLLQRRIIMKNIVTSIFLIIVFYNGNHCYNAFIINPVPHTYLNHCYQYAKYRNSVNNKGSHCALSDKYMENDLVAIRIPTSILLPGEETKFDNTQTTTQQSSNSNDDNHDSKTILCVVRPWGIIVPLCTHEDDVETDLFVDPTIQKISSWLDTVTDDSVCKYYGEGWYSQRVVPSLGGGPGYGAEADDVWSLDQDVLDTIRSDLVYIPSYDLGISHGEKARGGAIF